MNTINKEQILDWYTEDVLTKGTPSNVYAFAKEHEFEENEFYSHFSSLKDIEKHFFNAIMDATTETVVNAEEFPQFTAREKWLSFYYTFFENMKMNRSFVQHSLGNNNVVQNLKDLNKLSGLRSRFMDFAKEVGYKKIDMKSERAGKVQDRVVHETEWLHFLGTLRYWLKDTSANFEKTDVFIEKSLNAGFDLADTSKLQTVKDFGKFMVKEILPVK